MILAKWVSQIGFLLKAGPLTDDEWTIMRQHPVHAHDMLRAIDYLHPALDIPYCHHEKWNGTGYPRGLKGEEIPLVARIFAIVDVWDAVTSNRPYRQAWSRSKALAHIQEEAIFRPACCGSIQQIDLTKPNRPMINYRK